MMVQVNESQSVGRRLVSRLLTGFTPDRKFQPGSLVSPLTATFISRGVCLNRKQHEHLISRPVCLANYEI
jgi:hypothetical protein